MRIKKFLRKWLGVENDKEVLESSFRILAKAINETFDLKKQDKNIFNKMQFIHFKEIEENRRQNKDE